MEKEPTFTLAECQAEYLTGLFNGKNIVARSLIPETVEILITVKGKTDLIGNAEIQAVKKVVTFDEIKQSSGKALLYQSERAVIEIGSQRIIEELLK